MTDKIFDRCVLLLLFVAKKLGVTYKTLNVWIFVVIWPLLTLALVILVIVQQVKIRRWRATNSGSQLQEQSFR